MQNKEQIQQEVEKTLESLDGIQRATANPYLFTRIKARLQRNPAGFWSRATGFISRPAVAIAAIVLVISINAFVLFQSRPDSNPISTQIGQDDEQLFASEYNLSGTTIYDATVEQ